MESMGSCRLRNELRLSQKIPSDREGCICAQRKKIIAIVKSLEKWIVFLKNVQIGITETDVLPFTACDDCLLPFCWISACLFEGFIGTQHTMPPGEPPHHGLDSPGPQTGLVTGHIGKDGTLHLSFSSLSWVSCAGTSLIIISEKSGVVHTACQPTCYI